MDVIKTKFGEQLKTIRNIKGYTQESLAEKIGINLRQLARIEAGESFVKSDTLYKICTVLNIDPSVLFDFDIEVGCYMTGTDNKLHFNIIKKDNLIKLIPKNKIVKESEASEIFSFDSRMLIMAQKLQKNIFVDEVQNGIVICEKIYTPDGQIKIKEENNDNEISIQQLKDNLSKIANDKKKLEYINLAFNSLHNPKALEQLKFLIKGLELNQ